MKGKNIPSGAGFTPHQQKATGVNLWMKGKNIPSGAGFTLVEILIVISIVGIMLSVVMPVSYSMYKTYQESLEAEKVLIFLSSLKRESFLYSKESLVDTKDGKLVVDGSEKREFKDIFIHAERPILFYKNGTTSGGKLRLNMKSNIFLIGIDPPLGEMRLTRQ